MRRFAWLLALAPAPAMAQSEALLDCASQRASVSFREKLADAMLAPENAESDALFAHLDELARGCAARFVLDEAKTDAYFAYAIGRLPHDAYIERLARSGVSAAVVDEALDFGLGRANPAIDGDLSPAQRERLEAALTANGVALSALSQETWNILGAYIAATSQVWQASARLR